MKKRTRIFIITFGICALFFAAYFGFAKTGDFKTAYFEYEKAADVYEKSCYIPGNGGNPARQNLNRLLSLALNEKIPDADRLAYANESLEFLKTIRAQIDSIGENGKSAEEKFIVMRISASGVLGIRAGASAGEIANLALTKKEHAEEITKILYRMNDATEEIMRGIIEDEGKLTQKRITALNAALPNAEKDFDRLNELYRELEESRKNANEKWNAFMDAYR